MREEGRVGRVLLAGLVLAAVLALTSIGFEKGSSHDRHDPLPPGGGPATLGTVEPLPGLALDLSLDSMQETASGGIVSLTLAATSAVRVETLRLAMHLPPHVIFADGSKERSWEIALDAGGRSVLPLDLLIDRPGRFHLPAEAVGTAGGRAIRRGISFPLVVGRDDHRPEVRDGAIQHRGLIRSQGSNR
ncbi:MAG TPA: hypothetical protein VFG08_10860 [Candidatus Polarisedimenticolia bacterium]|nr:hypothetical protein [Candidatus Polarisedimenticolia bacterium]